MCYTWRFFLCYDLSGRIGENREESRRKRTVAKAGVVVLRENENINKQKKYKLWTKLKQP
jgi:hypothetical protein